MKYFYHIYITCSTLACDRYLSMQKTRMKIKREVTFQMICMQGRDMLVNLQINMMRCSFSSLSPFPSLTLLHHSFKKVERNQIWSLLWDSPSHRVAIGLLWPSIELEQNTCRFTWALLKKGTKALIIDYILDLYMCHTLPFLAN